MACFYCAKEGVPLTPDVGKCVECEHRVCVEGSRPPNRHHATQCTCRCGKLVCRIHYKLHSSQYPSTPSHCFGKDAAMLGAEALSGIELAMSRPPRGPQRQLCVDTVSRFLNFISPGRGTLAKALTAGSSAVMSDEDELDGMPIMLRQEALTLNAMAPLVPLIVRETTVAWKHVNEVERSDTWFEPVRPLLDALTDSKVSSLDLFATPDPLDALSPRLALLASGLDKRHWRRLFDLPDWINRLGRDPDGSQLSIESQGLPLSFSIMPPELQQLLAGSSYRTL